MLFSHEDEPGSDINVDDLENTMLGDRSHTQKDKYDVILLIQYVPERQVQKQRKLVGVGGWEPLMGTGFVLGRMVCSGATGNCTHQKDQCA
jgi:hypothetical protein